METYLPNQSYLRVATACPEVSIADVPSNVAHILDLYNRGVEQNVSLITFPELSVTGYTLGDLVNQDSLLEQAKTGLSELAQATTEHQTAMVVGLPLQIGSRLYNCAAVLAKGKILGIVPKTYRPNYNEFYEQRWYDEWQQDNIEIKLDGKSVPFGNKLLFEIGGVPCGVEICEDLWVLNSPSNRLASEGAYLVANPSASPEQIGKANYRRNLVAIQSAKMFGAYIYAGCDPSESTAEIVMGGHQLIASDGQILAERKPFANERLTVADLDIDHLKLDRRKQHAANRIGATLLKSETRRTQEDLLIKLDRNPFLPSEAAVDREERLETALDIQANGLAMRMLASRQERLVLGLSGGLDSTLALLVAIRAASILGRKPKDMIHALTMPGPASSDLTQSNAVKLAQALGVESATIPINRLVEAELNALGHDGITQDITYENVQARARTSLLFNYANKNQALVLGTGDLSEIALGWCTYNGDQQSHYNVNASIPKTLVRHLVNHIALKSNDEQVETLLNAILNTTVSPELTKDGESGISQSTEELIGPYELHDFFLYHLVRWGDKPAKIAYLAERAFSGSYDSQEIGKWLKVFTKRFASSQFKRENQPNGPKVGSVSLSPRGDWRMPPDLHNAAIWQ